MTTFGQQIGHISRLTEKERCEFDLLGMLMRHQGGYEKTALRHVMETGLRPDHFDRESHRAFYRIILTLGDEGRPFDFIEAYKQLPQESSDWCQEMAEMMEHAPIAQNEIYFANRILAKVVSEKAIEKTQSLSHALKHEVFDTVPAVQDRVSSTLTAVAAIEPVKMGAAINIAEATERLLDAMTKAMADAEKGKAILIPTGLEDFDAHYVGLNRQGLHVLGARPGVGKTTTALNIALSAAEQGFGVLYFTHEMTSVELLKKLVAMRARITTQKMLTGDFDEDETNRFTKAIEDIQSRAFYMDDRSMPNWDHVSHRMKIMCRQHQIDLVVIDYVQQLIPGETGQFFGNRTAELTHITGAIKQLSQEFHTAILVCAQLNRSADDGVSLPRMSMLKDCGSIEQDADTVMLVHRAAGTDEEDQRDMLIVDKHRHAEAKIAFYLDMQLVFGNIRTSGYSRLSEIKAKSKSSGTRGEFGKKGK
jgi:replicative DNA helicase